MNTRTISYTFAVKTDTEINEVNRVMQEAADSLKLPIVGYMGAQELDISTAEGSLRSRNSRNDDR